MKHPYLLALYSGILLGLAWPTYGISLLAFIGFVPLLFAELKLRNNHPKSGVKVFLAAYITFFSWNLIATWWIYYSTFFGMLFAVLVNSLLMSLVFLIYHKVALRLPAKIHLVFLVAIWLAFEKFHLNWAFSWPWLNLGNVFATSTSYIQWYEYTGSFGGGLWVWLLNIGFFKLIQKFNKEGKSKEVLLRLGTLLGFIVLPIVISLFIKSNYTEKENRLHAVILQPNVDPYDEKLRLTNNQIGQMLVELAAEKTDDSTDVILAPETVFYRDMRYDAFTTSPGFLRLKRFLGEYPNANFIGGISLVEVIHNQAKVGPETNRYNANTWYNEYNSAFLMSGAFDSIPLYHKSKLVVGVETFPYKSILEPIFGDIMLDVGGTVSIRSTQKERSILQTAKFKAAPIVCYESVYGEFDTGYVSKGANFLAIITNDAWWRNTQGHKQHLNYARLRAIETRRSVVRSANTGVSAIINQTGEIEQTLPYDEQGVIKGTINLNDSITFYVKYGDYIARVAIFITGILLLFAFTKKRTV